MFKAKSFLEMLRAMWHLNFPSLCLSTGLGLPRELTGPWADAWHHPFLQIRKALHVLAAPQCPTEIEWEVKSSWQDLRLGTEAAKKKDFQLCGQNHTTKDGYRVCRLGWKTVTSTQTHNCSIWDRLLSLPQTPAPGLLGHLKTNHQPQSLGGQFLPAYPAEPHDGPRSPSHALRSLPVYWTHSKACHYVSSILSNAWQPFVQKKFFLN